MDGILRACASYPDPVLVGHEPTLGHLCGRLMGAPHGAIQLARAAVAILDVDRIPTTRPARLKAYLPPDYLLH
jgi:phosphohistidine phosphatase SixA